MPSFKVIGFLVASNGFVFFSGEIDWKCWIWLTLYKGEWMTLTLTLGCHKSSCTHCLTICTKFGCQSFRTQVISYPGHFIPTLVISYILFGHFVPSNNDFVPRSFRTHFGHFVPRLTGFEMTIWWSIRTQVISYPFLVISYPFWSFRTQHRWMDGWIDERTDRRVLIEMTN